MKHLYYARHGESFVNTGDHFGTKVGAKNDLPLTPTGRQQAKGSITAALASGLHIDTIVCSPLVRAHETAEIFAEALGYPIDRIVVSDLLKEIQFGVLEDTSWSAWWNAGKTYANLGEIEGAETIEVLQQRAEKAFHFVESLPGETILVVAHGAFGRAFKRVIDGRPYTDEFLHGTPIPHAEITRFI